MTFPIFVRHDIVGEKITSEQEVAFASLDFCEFSLLLSKLATPDGFAY
jgi:hypothetical protein